MNAVSKRKFIIMKKDRNGFCSHQNQYLSQGTVMDIGEGGREEGKSTEEGKGNES